MWPARSHTNPVPVCAGTPSPSDGEDSSVAVRPTPTTCTTEGESRSNSSMVERSSSDKLAREPLVDVALVGDLVGVDGGCIGQKEDAGDALGGAAMVLVPASDRRADMGTHARMGGELGEGRLAAAHELVTAGRVEPGQD